MSHIFVSLKIQTHGFEYFVKGLTGPGARVYGYHSLTSGPCHHTFSIDSSKSGRKFQILNVEIEGIEKNVKIKYFQILNLKIIMAFQRNA